MSAMGEATITIRRSERDDWRALKSIRLEALADTPDAYGSTWKENSKWSDAQWKNAATNRLYYLAYRDDAVVAWCRAVSMTCTRAPVGSTPCTSHHGARQRHLGPTRRDDVCVARGEGVDEIYLHVTSSVGRARAFYTRLAFGNG